ncbi:MAG: glycosyltransferase family 39 protein [Epsilonproteobacteria bacterium]|nr:glycosyltransferase family 39 protein [Campylobacterota bacterium]
MDRVALLALTFLSFYATLGYYPLFNLDEGAFSEATREMLERRDFITTYLNGALRFDKPILIYWFQALSASIFGLNEVAMRLPSALVATAWAYLIYRFSVRHFDQARAYLATLFMVGSIQISIIAKAAIADALLNLFIAASMFCFYRYYESRQKIFLYATYAAIALGTLTKGPVAILIPLAVSGLFLAKEWRLWLRSILDPIGIAIFLAIAAPWYIAEYLEQGHKFVEGFFLKHNLSRFSSQAMEGHRGPIFYYLIVLLVGLTPFTSIAIKTITKIKEWFAAPLTRYLGIWFLFVFIFFSLSKTKLPHYIIYGYTPLFILMALYFDQIRSKTALLLPYWLFHAIFALLPFIKPIVLEYTKPGSYEYFIIQALDFGVGYVAYFLFALLVGVALLRLGKRRAITVAAFITLISLNFFIAKVYAEAAEGPIKEAALLAKERGWKIKMEGINVPSFYFYAETIADDKSAIILIKRSALPNYPGATILYQRGAIALIKEQK